MKPPHFSTLRSTAAAVDTLGPTSYRLNRVAVKPAKIMWVTRCAYYAFVFSLPFEMAELDVASGLLTLSKFLGYLFVALALFQPSLCFRKVPKAVWYFAAYLAIVAVFSFLVFLDAPAGAGMRGLIVVRLFSRIQMLALLWISYNLMTHENLAKGTLLTLTLSGVTLVVLQLLGLAGEPATSDRLTLFDANPNSVATVASIALLSLFGLAYAREKNDWKAQLLFWASSALLAGLIIRTGARGAVLALVLSFGVLLLKKGSIATKLKMGFLALIGIIFLAVISYQVDIIRERWERTFYEGSLAGRDVIFAEAWSMFLERPVFGWGPINNYYELGSRLSVLSMDPHNVYLWILTEVGLIGFIPFLAGLWLCLWAAWKSRFNIQGVTPLMMITFLLASGLKGSWHTRKLFWIVLAYTLASSAYSATMNLRRNKAFAGRGHGTQPKTIPEGRLIRSPYHKNNSA